MKQQVQRLSPHQNGKVFGVLTAIGSLAFLVPMFLIFTVASPRAGGPTGFMIVLFPLLYLVLGYLSVAVWCWLYNVMFKYIGGIEYEPAPQRAA